MSGANSEREDDDDRFTDGCGTGAYLFHPRREEWSTLIASEGAEAARSRIRSGRDAWIINTYLALREVGYPALLTDRLVADSVCICHYDDVPREGYPAQYFIAAIRADRDRAFLADAEIVQSPASREHVDAYYIPHWPQPGLRPRSPSRGARISNIGYFGLPRNLAASLKTEEFNRQLAELGVTLRICNGPKTWADYSDIDVALAVRDGTEYFLASKPATKLFNAWLAGVPIIVGREPAYEYYRESALDYIVCTSPEEVIEAIAALRASPETYLKMVENGRRRAIEVNESATVRHWIHVIDQALHPLLERRRQRAAAMQGVVHFGGQLVGKLRKAMRGRMYVRGMDSNGQPVVYRGHVVRKATRYLERMLFGPLDW